MTKIYTPEMYEWIKARIDGVRIKDMAQMVSEKFKIDMTYKKMKSYLKNHNLKNNLAGIQKGVERYALCTPEQEEFIKANYKGLGNAELAQLVNNKFGTSFTREQIKTFKNRRHWDSGLTGQFPKGHIPINKGKKMPREVYEKAKATMFQKGNLPHNTLPVGTELKDCFGYWKVKTAEPSVWEFKHRLIWEKANGKIPDKAIVIILDGNRDNLDLKNLACISYREHLMLNNNHLRKQDAELTKTGINLAKLKLKTKDLKKKGKR